MLTLHRYSTSGSSGTQEKVLVQSILAGIATANNNKSLIAAKTKEYEFKLCEYYDIILHSINIKITIEITNYKLFTKFHIFANFICQTNHKKCKTTLIYLSSIYIYIYIKLKSHLSSVMLLTRLGLPTSPYQLPNIINQSFSYFKFVTVSECSDQIARLKTKKWRKLKQHSIKNHSRMAQWVGPAASSYI